MVLQASSCFGNTAAGTVFILILMFLQMQRDIRLDNVINLRQYNLRYTVANPTSLRNVAFQWFISEYMQLASGFLQLARRNKVHFHCLFEGKMLIEH